VSYLEVSSNGKRIAWVGEDGSPQWLATAPHSGRMEAIDIVRQNTAVS
jgi:hypothetical protein